jgi:hypothetical protein
MYVETTQGSAVKANADDGNVVVAMVAEVFIYTGNGGERVPEDVVRVRVDPSVTSIPTNAFNGRNKLTEVELCEGLVEIGEWSFKWCGYSITKIDIPNSLKRICGYAFSCSLRCLDRIHDGIESIGEAAFEGCIFTNFRVPSPVIPERILIHCRSLFSLELSEDVTEIGSGTFSYCYCLRNVAFPPNADIGDNVFIREGSDTLTDLLQLFGSEAEIIRELQHRFDGLPIHSVVYYQSYHEGVLQNLIAAINMRSDQHWTLRSKLDPTGNQQDCLGMTPLHILACSSVHDLEHYRVIVENYPTNLITEDRWGATPLLYAFWGAAPAEIIQFLLESYRSLYPGYVFNWTMMVETMGRCDTLRESIENLLCVKQMHFPEQPIDWDHLLDEFLSSSHHSFGGALFTQRMRFLVMCGMLDRVETLAFKIWRDCITKMIHTANFKWGENMNNSIILQRIRVKVAQFEEECPRLKEITTILELALWKLRMNEKLSPEEATHCQKKIKTDESDIRQQCRVTCGADVVIRHVLPYLISMEDKEPDYYAESDSIVSSDDESDEESDSNDSSDDKSNNSM